MRQIVLDTETTGLKTEDGHRLIEIGCIELVNRHLTKNNWHSYLDPERPIDSGATKIHGITNDMLTGQPRFSEVASSFLEFIQGAELIIHNATFDIGFLNYELRLLGAEWGKIEDRCKVIDTLVLARAAYPKQNNKLDDLCRRYNIDSSHRELHGALLDANLLVEVYLALTRVQSTLDLGESHDSAVSAEPKTEDRLSGERHPLMTLEPTPEEEQAHQERLLALDKASGGKCLWLLRTSST